MFFQESENVLDESGPRTRDPRRLPSLTQVLTRETGCQDIHALWDRGQTTDIAVKPNTGKVFFENHDRTLIDLAEPGGLVTGISQARLDASDPGE